MAAAGVSRAASGLEEAAAVAADAVEGAVEGAESGVGDGLATVEEPATPGTTRPDTMKQDKSV